MISKRVYTVPAFLVATMFLPVTVQSIAADDEVQAFVDRPEILLSASVRRGTEIRGRQLGEFLGDAVVATIKEGSRGLGVVHEERPIETVTFRVQLLSREDGMIDRTESELIKMDPGSDSTLNPNLGLWTPRGLDDQEFTVYPSPQVSKYPPQQVPKECSEATHAVTTSLASDDATTAGFLTICLRSAE